MRLSRLLLAGLVAGCSTQPSAPQALCNGVEDQVTSVPRTATNQLAVDGGLPGALGIFDPSLVYAPGAPSGALAYSVVGGPGDISTSMAVSSDEGTSWAGAGRVNEAVPLSVTVPSGSLRCPTGTCNGTLVHEVPSLVEDASDPDHTRRWKVFVHSYLVLSSGTFAYDVGYLGLFSAPEPEGPWTDEGKAIGWLGESSFSSDGAHTLLSAFPSMVDCVALTEPGALLTADGSLDLAVGCAYAVGGVPHLRIELLRSNDSARTFFYVAHLLDDADAAFFGSDLNAADLFVAAGRTYLSVTPSGPTALGFVGYRGCVILELTASGDAVERMDGGAPVVFRTLDGPGQPFAGACTYAEGASAVGYLLPQLSLDGGVPFRIFGSGVAAP